MKAKLQSFLSKPGAMPVLLIILGAVLFLFPGMMLKSVVRLGGIALIIGGVNAIDSWVYRRTEGSSRLDIVGGVIAVLGGLYLVIKPDSLVKFFPTVAGILIILCGVFYFLKALDARRKGAEKSKAGLLMPAVSVILGIILLNNPFGTMELLVRILGAVLIYNGLSSLWIVNR